MDKNSKNSVPKGSNINLRDSIDIQRIIMVILAFALVACVLVFQFLQDNNFAQDNNNVRKILYIGTMILLSGGIFALFVNTQLRLNATPNYEKPKYYYPVCGALLSIFALLIVYIYFGMFPFGSKTIMVVDMYHQYAPLISGLKDTVFSGKGLAYSFNLGLGAPYLPLFAYYLASPFNILLLLFPFAYFAEGILLVITLKIAFAAAAFTLCVQELFKKYDVSVTVPAVMYSLMTYTMAYSWNIMWLDSMICLPLLILAFERMMKKGKPLFYIFTLAYTIYANYYMAFMVAVFMVLWFLAFLFREKRSSSEQITYTARFFINSLLGGCLVMFIVLPVYLSLSTTSAANGELPALSANFSLLEFFSRHLFKTSITIRSGKLPNIYCGVLALLALPIYASMKTVPIRRKITNLTIVGILALSMVLSTWNILWHGLHAPNDLPYRFSFLYSFMLILITFEVIMRIREIKPKNIAVGAFGIIAFLILAEQFKDKLTLSFDSIYISLLLVLIYSAVLLLGSKDKLKPTAASLLILVILSNEMIRSANFANEGFYNSEYHSSHAAYFDNDTTIGAKKAMEYINSLGDDSTFSRSEFIPRKSLVDPALFSYRGITIFASSTSYEETKFLNSLGYETNGVNSHISRSLNLVGDSLLGVKYFAVKADMAEADKSFSGYEKINVITSGDVSYNIYENKFAMPLAFAVDPSITSWTYSYYDAVGTQRSLMKALTGQSGDIYTNMPVSVSAGNASINGTSFNTLDSAGTTEFKAITQGNDPIFVYVDCQAAKGVKISCNGVSYGSGKNWMVGIGSVPAGSEIKISVETTGAVSGTINVVSLNTGVFSSMVNKINSNALVTTDISDSKIIGRINTEEASTIFTSIPYDKGWSVYVDGSKVDTFKLCESMLSFNVAAGEHTVKLVYSTPGLAAGIAVSLISLLIVFVIILNEREKDGKRVPKFYSDLVKRITKPNK